MKDLLERRCPWLNENKYNKTLFNYKFFVPLYFKIKQWNIHKLARQKYWRRILTWKAYEWMGEWNSVNIYK